MSDVPFKSFSQFRGEFTNADPEDIPDDMALLLQNCVNRNGKLVKTFGFGSYLDYALGFVPLWIGAYSNPHLSATLGTGSGYAIMAYGVDASTKAVTIKYFNGTSKAWASIDDLVVGSMGSYYHSYLKNPVIDNNGIIRFLPGSENAPGGHEGVGIWLGYIDRDLFDGLYTAGTAAEVSGGTKDYEAGFYALDTKITQPTVAAGGTFPTIAFAPTAVSGGGSLGGDFSLTESVTRHYKISAVYDGICEGPLSSDHVSVTINAAQLCRLMTRIAANSMNRRITSLKIYRSDTADSGFALVHNVDLLRETGKTESVVDGAYGGHRMAYVPGLSTYDFVSGKTYLLGLNGPGSTEKKGTISQASKGFALSGSLSGAGWTCFLISASEFDVDDLWDCEWNLYDSAAPTVSIAHGTFGAYGGTKTVVISSATADPSGYGKYIGGVIQISHSTYGDIGGQIVGYAGNAFLLKTAPIGYFADEDHILMSISDGLYRIVESSTDVFDIYIYDYNLTAVEAHPYPDDDVCTANGQFASVVAGMLLAGNVRVDPTGENEYYKDHFAYSLPGQFDVFPVSRRERVPDIEGGPITGMATSFNSGIFEKKNGTFRLTIDDPEDITTWRFSESAFRRGNLAPDGTIQVGDNVYLISVDGIYELSPNDIASVDDTALIKFRASEPINDSFMALTSSQKAAIISGYDPINHEIIFRLASGTSNVRAFDVANKTWRTILSGVSIGVMGNDHNGNLIAYDVTTDKLFSPLNPESVAFKIRTKRQRISSIRDEVLSELRVIFKSVPSTLSNNLYTNQFGPELITGTSAMSAWSVPANGWAYADSKWTHTAGHAAYLVAGAWVPTAGRYYKVVVSVTTTTAGAGVRLYIGDTAAGDPIKTSATFTYYVTAATATALTFVPLTGGTWAGSITACSVKEMPFDNPVAGASLTGGTLEVKNQKVSFKKRCQSAEIEIYESAASASAVEVHNIEIYSHQ